MSRIAFYRPVLRPAFGSAFFAARDPFANLFNVFDAFENGASTAQDKAPEVRYSAPVQIAETEAAYRVAAELPGVNKDDIEVSIEGAQVTIKAKVNALKPAEGERVLRSERSEGSFVRSFTLANEIDEGKAVAKYENGVLSLELPKKAVQAAKRLAIH
jgi:HSP20 family protein